MQIHKEAKRLAQEVGLRVCCANGGANIAEQISELKRGAEVGSRTVFQDWVEIKHSTDRGVHAWENDRSSVRKCWSRDKLKKSNIRRDGRS